MSAARVRQAIEQFLALVVRPDPATEHDLVALMNALDELSLVARTLDPDLEFEGGHPDPPNHDYWEYLAQAQMRFPGLPLYNIPDLVTVSPGDSKITLGDPYDDIADMRKDLEGVSWRFEHTSENDALWHCELGYRSHWGYHLTNLRWCLFYHQFEPPAA